VTPAERATLIGSLAAMPAELRERQQWLLWRFIQKPGQAKPAKVPFYANGQLRGWPMGKPKDGQPTEAQPQASQGAELDRAALVSFDDAVAALRAKPAMSGIGFAFLPGDGLVGVDIDGAIDLETGEISELCQEVVALCPSYAETSVSGTGLHIILKGHTEKFKDDLIGLEVYCDSQYFTCTGAQWAGSSNELLPVTPAALAAMRAMVEASKEQQREAKEAGQAAKPPKHPPPPAPTTARAAAPFPGGQKGADFKRVNDAAMADLDAWVPTLFPGATRRHCDVGDGFQVTSRALGRNLQDSLQIMPTGIFDFGEECGKSPIDLVVQWRGLSLRDALHWLAGLVGVQLAQRQARRPAPPPLQDERHEPVEAPALDEGAEPPDEDGADAPTPGGLGERKKKRRPLPPGMSLRLNQLREHFALIYGTDTVWDGENRIIMKIANMGHAHGSDLVKIWKGGEPCWRRSEGGRWTVKQEAVVFDPTGKADPETHVNLYGGFPTEPKKGDVGPMLELIDFLVSRTGATKEERDPIYHWLLCWLAYPLQNPGGKLRTSVLMYGDEGAGKNFLTDTMVEIYGQYGVTVGQDELEDKFNDWRSCKLFVVGDEVSTKTELTHNKNRLKAIITGTHAQINPKNLPRRTEANHANVWFNSNEQQALALDNSDRRYLVVWTPKAREIEFYQKLGKWRAAGGVAAWLHFLLHYEMTGFDLFAPAPSTKEKEDLIDMNRKSAERFWMDWRSGQLDLPYRTCSGEQAYRAYLKYAQRAGDRFPSQRPVFTRLVMRVSDTKGSPMTEKVMKVDYGPDSAADVRPTRMLLVQDPPEGAPLGAWATECWVSMEKELKRYLGRFGGATDGGDGGE
jgi:hypothetical protein